MAKSGWNELLRFPGRHTDWQEINRLIEQETGDTELCFEDEDAYRQSVREGWITIEDGDTVLWCELYDE